MLQSYFFTNPYRENDKVTQWFAKHIRDPLTDDPRVIFATVCFRWFTWIPTGIALMNYVHPTERFNTAGAHLGLLTKWNLVDCMKLLMDRQDKGLQIFTGAFNISNSGSTDPKIHRVCRDYITPVWDARSDLIPDLESCKTLEQMHKVLMKFPGLGGSGFMAYEIVCDLMHTSYFESVSGADSWANPGPGAKRGLNRVLERPIDAPVSKGVYLTESRQIMLEVNRKLRAVKYPLADMRTIEHSLCEFDKYERARLNDGHMKRRYNGGKS